MTANKQSEYEQFVKQHYYQLTSSAIPFLYWHTLYQKLVDQIYDSGDTFTLTRIDYEGATKEENDPVFQLQIKLTDGLDCKNPAHIYLVDHAWTFRLEQIARKMLSEYGDLVTRMCTLMGINSENLSKVEVIDKIFQESWKHSNTYSFGNEKDVENRLSIWYIMDELGCAMRHSNNPNFRMVPFIFAQHNITYSVIFPTKNCKFAEVVTRDFVEGVPENDRAAFLLPWISSDFSQKSFLHNPAIPGYFLTGHVKETLPMLENLGKHGTSKVGKLKVFTQYRYVSEYLNDENFELVANEDEADILWLTMHFKNFEKLSTESPEKYVNQFPFEYILTVKDLLSIVCRLNHENPNINSDLKIPPDWLPTTYNLKTEINQFVSYYQNRVKKNLDNHWIIKPFNLARGLDIHITSNLNYILRLPSSGPKIAQKYIENPVLFDRPEIGRVKFDIRYVILLKSVKPLKLYAYKNFFLRFANIPYELNEFHVYEKHFTVMNYNQESTLKHMLCSEFLTLWEQQYESFPWSEIETKILKMLREVFESATMNPPPCGIPESPQSRALYAVDIMLAHEDGNDKVQPKLLEINWTPDCQRACEYYKEFFNDVFKLLFLNVENSDVFHVL